MGDCNDNFYWPDNCYLFEHAKARQKAYEENNMSTYLPTYGKDSNPRPHPGDLITIEPECIGHTSNPEYEKLGSDKTMEALRDRTIKVDVPFLMDWDKEMKTMEKILDAKKEEERLNAQCCGKDFSILDKYAIKESAEVMRAAGFDIKEPPLLCDLEEEEPQYQGHPVGTPPPPPEKCTCDLMLLMAQGCKCGYIEIERKNAEQHNGEA